MTRTSIQAEVVIIGADPAGLFAAMRLAGLLSALVLDSKSRTGGAGGATDGKLNLSPHVGFDLDELRLSETKATEYIEAVDRCFLGHGADPTLHGTDEAAVRWWMERVSWLWQCTPKGYWDIILVPIKQRHTGTDFAHRVTAAMAETVRRRGGRFLL